MQILRGFKTLQLRIRDIWNKQFLVAPVSVFAAQFAVLVLVLGITPLAQAVLYQQTISIDGNFGDWTSPGNILTNPDQTSTDARGNTAADEDFPVQSTGRDLASFAYTWDSTNLYFYVSRYGSTNNTNWWWFYLDLDADGLMETGEKVFSVEWSGNTGKTEANLYDYIASAGGGDPLECPSGGGCPAPGQADGYTLPGTISNATNIYGSPPSSVIGGSANGLQMEARLPWSTMGFSDPQPLGFHISSSNSTNLPAQIDDNMDGVNGNFMFFADTDLSVSKSAVAMDGLTPITDAVAGRQFQYIVSVANGGSSTEDVDGVSIDDILPAGLAYNSATASQGSYDSVSGTWTIGALAASTSATLTIIVTVNDPPNSGDPATSLLTTNTADNLQLLALDLDNTNNSASVAVTLHPGPVLSVSKSSVVLDDGLNGGEEFHVPGALVEYTLVVTNTSTIAADYVVLTDALPAETSYEPGTLEVGGVSKTDAGGDDEGEVVGETVYVNLGTVPLSSTTTVNFQVRIK